MNGFVKIISVSNLKTNWQWVERLQHFIYPLLIPTLSNVGLMISNIPPQTQSGGSLSLKCSGTRLWLKRRESGPTA
jgi:hypothetical protein